MKRAEADTLAEHQKGSRTVLRLACELLAWVWALFFLGYFYYSHDFYPMLQYLWKQVFG
ncbi:MAG: hypothetical protein HY694_12510 [Deltaproteobacteria bacterium]|nr:hypothetical protein [Deltaproteobacteria bacterium]